MPCVLLVWGYLLRTLWCLEVLSTHARNISGFVLGSTQAEVLLPPGVSFVVVSRRTLTSGVEEVRCRQCWETDDAPPLHFGLATAALLPVKSKAHEAVNREAAARRQVGASSAAASSRCVFPFTPSAWRGPTQVLRLQLGVWIVEWAQMRFLLKMAELDLLLRSKVRLHTI